MAIEQRDAHIGPGERARRVEPAEAAADDHDSSGRFTLRNRIIVRVWLQSPSSRGPTSIVETACPLDCPDACSLAVTVQQRQGDRARRLAQESGHRRLHLREGPQVRRARLRAGSPALSGRPERAARAKAVSSGSRGTKRSSSSRSASAARRRRTAAPRFCRFRTAARTGC